MTPPHRIESTIHFERRRKGTRKIAKTNSGPPVQGKLPRITRLMALAIHFDRLIRIGEITDYAELARLGNVTRARVTQIMNLLLLAPEIQEQILCLARIERGSAGLHLRDLQSFAAICSWEQQMRSWDVAK